MVPYKDSVVIFTRLGQQLDPKRSHTRCLQIAKPRPVPPYFLVVEECTNVNFSKSVGKASFGIPDENYHVNACDRTQTTCYHPFQTSARRGSPLGSTIVIIYDDYPIEDKALTSGK